MIYIALSLLLAAAMLAGCASASAAKVYGKDDTEITAKAGDTFTIQLESNPTTGYSWVAAIGDETILELTNSEYLEKPVDTAIVGSGGVDSLTFKALKAGAATITLTYERSWEKDSPAETIVYSVTVK